MHNHKSGHFKIAEGLNLTFYFWPWRQQYWKLPSIRGGWFSPPVIIWKLHVSFLNNALLKKHLVGGPRFKSQFNPKMVAHSAYSLIKKYTEQLEVSALFICQECDLLTFPLHLLCLQTAVIWGSGSSPCQLNQQHLEQVTDHLWSQNKAQLQRWASPLLCWRLPRYEIDFSRALVMPVHENFSFFKGYAAIENTSRMLI